MKNVVVTGANGFVGSALLRELADHGVMVYAVVKSREEPVESIRELPGVELVYCEMDALNTLPEKIKGRRKILLKRIENKGISRHCPDRIRILRRVLLCHKADLFRNDPVIVGIHTS